eukprot:03299.XXX_122892_123017_1 [CDS] Oithona nana genome sequencing.
MFFFFSETYMSFVTLVLLHSLHMMHDFRQSQKFLSLLYPDL